MIKFRRSSFSPIDGPLGSAQVQSNILTCIGFPKTSTEVLQGPRVVMALGVFPRNTWKPGSRLSTITITMKHPSTCYSSVTLCLHWLGHSNSKEEHSHTTLKIWISIFWNAKYLVYFDSFKNQTESKIHQMKKWLTLNFTSILQNPNPYLIPSCY